MKDQFIQNLHRLHKSKQCRLFRAVQLDDTNALILYAQDTDLGAIPSLFAPMIKSPSVENRHYRLLFSLLRRYSQHLLKCLNRLVRLSRKSSDDLVLANKDGDSETFSSDNT